MLAAPKRSAAMSQSPCWTKNRHAVATAPSARKTPSIRFRMPAKSASAPRMGAARAMVTSAAEEIHP